MEAEAEVESGRAPPKRPRCTTGQQEQEDGGGAAQAEAAGSLATVSTAHEAWVRQFEGAHGRRPTREDIDGDEEAKANAALMRELTIAAAQPFVAGQCQHFIWRKKRYCASRAAHATARWCSDHEPTKLVQLQRDSVAGHQKKKLERDTVSVQKLQEAPASQQDPSSAGPRRGRGVKTNQDRNPKRMTNPLSKQFQTPVPAPDWPTVYADPTRPLLLDIGCARGRFLQELALRRPESYNYCGVEIFAPLVVAANDWVASAAHSPDGGSTTLRHLHFIAANINASIESLRFPNLRVVCLQFPDPWHTKHGKRRVMSNAFAAQIAALLPARGLFYFCSDHAAIAWHIRECMFSTGWFDALSDGEIVSQEVSDGMLWGRGREDIPPQVAAAADAADADGSDLYEHEEDVHEHLTGRGEKSKCRSGDVTPATATGGALTPAAAADPGQDGQLALPRSSDGWLKQSPFPVPTERDRVCELKWRPVWRMMLSRRETRKKST